jgi:hypothetical protein
LLAEPLKYAETKRQGTSPPTTYLHESKPTDRTKTLE